MAGSAGCTDDDNDDGDDDGDDNDDGCISAVAVDVCVGVGVAVSSFEMPKTLSPNADRETRTFERDPLVRVDLDLLDGAAVEKGWSKEKSEEGGGGAIGEEEEEEDGGGGAISEEEEDGNDVIDEDGGGFRGVDEALSDIPEEALFVLFEISPKKSLSDVSNGEMPFIPSFVCCCCCCCVCCCCEGGELSGLFPAICFCVCICPSAESWELSAFAALLSSSGDAAISKSLAVNEFCRRWLNLPVADCGVDREEAGLDA